MIEMPSEVKLAAAFLCVRARGRAATYLHVFFLRAPASRSPLVGSSSWEKWEREAVAAAPECGLPRLAHKHKLAEGRLAVAEKLLRRQNLLIFFPSPLRPPEIGWD